MAGKSCRLVCVWRNIKDGKGGAEHENKARGEGSDGPENGSASVRYKN